MTQHQGALRAFIVSLMPGSPGVDDVLQETNLVLWEKKEQFQEGTNFLAWAFTIARYEVMRQRDRLKRDGKLVFSDELISSLADEDDGILSEDRHLLALDLCMTKLSESEKSLIQYRYTPGKTLEHLAEHSGKSPGSLRIALYRIRAALKRCVEKQLKGELA